jgi:hypothetical protein
MPYLILLFCSFLFVACSNNQSSAPANKQGAVSTTATSNKATSLSRESEMEILDECIDNAKATLGAEKSYALCRCILRQVQEKHPGADSTALVTHLSDTAEVAQMAQKCK